MMRELPGHLEVLDTLSLVISNGTKHTLAPKRPSINKQPLALSPRETGMGLCVNTMFRLDL